jgi:hypothetical protein
MPGEQIILSGLTVDQLTQAIGEIVQQRVNDAVRNIKAEELQERFLSISEVQKMFVPAISRKTVDNWTREGILLKHVIAGKPVYKYSQVMEAVKCVKKYQHSQTFK